MKPRNGTHKPRKRSSSPGKAKEKEVQADPPACQQQDAPATSVEAGQLSPAETNQFKECEDTLRTGLQTFFEVGSALLTIRQGRLYRMTHDTFEEYCLD